MAHQILRLWLRPVEKAPIQERNELALVAGKGVEGDHAFGGLRHVVIVFEDDWNAAAAELGRAVDPVGRRGNVLLSGGDGGLLVGKRVRLGGALLDIKGIVAPCPVMDRAAPGLMEALKPHGRAGIWGRVLEASTVRVGETLIDAREGMRVA